MRIKERYQLAAELGERYWAAGRRERGDMLDAFCLTTGYSRRYAIGMLRLAGLTRLHRQLPFPLLGLHIDNGLEFLNAALIDYCRRQEIELSRGRPFHSDDNPHVDQTNGYLVRRLLSNFRLDSAEQLAWLDRLYTDLLRPFQQLLPAGQIPS
jgi:transposase InsO family protein